MFEAGRSIAILKPISTVFGPRLAALAYSHAAQIPTGQHAVQEIMCQPLTGMLLIPAYAVPVAI